MAVNGRKEAVGRPGAAAVCWQAGKAVAKLRASGAGDSAGAMLLCSRPAHRQQRQQQRMERMERLLERPLCWV